MNNSTCDCMYLRKSRNDADLKPKEEKETLARHESQLQKLALHYGCHITAVYREVVSGESILTRPVLQKLLQEVENGLWRSVLVMDLDRLARGNTSDQGRIMECFQYSGTKIITPQKIYDPRNEYDEEYMEFGLFLSRREYRMINRRIQRGRKQSACEGKYIGNKPPYGYVRKKLDNEKGWSLEIHLQQAKVVRWIFEQYHGICILDSSNASSVSAFCDPVCGPDIPKRSVRQIVSYLNDHHIPTAAGKSWSPSTVYAILNNPVYAGYIKHGARPRIQRKTAISVENHRPCNPDCPIYPGRHQALVPKKLLPDRYKNPYQGIGSS